VSAARQDGLFCKHSRVQVAAPMRVGHGFRRVSCASRAISKIAIERLLSICSVPMPTAHYHAR
jgi:hypothetical protein